MHDQDDVSLFAQVWRWSACYVTAVKRPSAHVVAVKERKACSLQHAIACVRSSMCNRRPPRVVCVASVYLHTTVSQTYQEKSSLGLAMSEPSAENPPLF